MTSIMSGRASEIVLNVDWACRFKLSATSVHLTMSVLERLAKIPREGLATAPANFCATS